MNVVLVALVMAPGAWFTVSVKLCVASGRTPLVAVKVRAIGAAGARRRGAGEHAGAVALNVTPLGSAPLSLNAGGGTPGRRHRERARVPTVNVVPAALVIAGAWAPGSPSG